MGRQAHLLEDVIRDPPVEYRAGEDIGCTRDTEFDERRRQHKKPYQKNPILFFPNMIVGRCDALSSEKVPLCFTLGPDIDGQ